jgi:hypothetical protein
MSGAVLLLFDVLPVMQNSSESVSNATKFTVVMTYSFIGN